MKLYLSDQADRFDELLKDLITRPTMRFDKDKLTEKVSTINVSLDKSLKDINIDFLFDYRIFPSNILTFKTQWGQEGRKI